MIVFATGIFDNPRKLGVNGENFAKVSHYYKEGHSLLWTICYRCGREKFAIEAAIDLYRNGAHVTLVHRGETAIEGIKPSLLLDMRNLLEKGQIDFFLIPAYKILMKQQLQSIHLKERLQFKMIMYFP